MTTEAMTPTAGVAPAAAASTVDHQGAQTAATEAGEQEDLSGVEFLDQPQDDTEGAELLDGGESAEAGAGDAGAQPQAATGDVVDIEHEGQTYKVPAALKDSFLRNADYTQKTQQLAEARRQLEARDTAARANIREFASIVAMNDQIQAYDNVDWDRFQQEDPNGAQREWRNRSLLLEQRATAVESFRQKEQAAALEKQRERATRFEEGLKVLAKEIPNWSPTLAKQVMDHGANKYGFTAQEIAGISDPRMVRVLHDAMTGSQKATTAAKVENIQAAQIAKPAARVGSGASSIPKDPSKMSIAQYHAWRNG